ncbi:MAG TPA: DUF1292 domain-containing protein [Bacilli bacterium]|nr:DUF1292 domain-containing protein [Bacilli bacterium]
MSDNHVHNENCDHDHDHEHEAIVVLTDDEGNEREFLVIETFEVETKNYAVLVSANPEEEDGIILRLETDENGEDYLIDIEDEDEWNKVLAAYESMAEQA